jgi:hypothetical protein
MQGEDALQYSGKRSHITPGKELLSQWWDCDITNAKQFRNTGGTNVIIKGRAFKQFKKREKEAVDNEKGSNHIREM